MTTSHDAAGSAAAVVRPPTPPKTKSVDKVIADVIGFLDISDSSFAAQSLHTPPPSSPIKTSVHSKQPKKIRFDPQPSLIHHPSSELASSSQSSEQGSAAPHHKKSTRSILKPFNPEHFVKATDADVCLASIPPNRYSCLADMLEAIAVQLARSDRAGKLDAYLAFQNSLREYRNRPDRDVLLRKLPEFEGYLRRDMDSIYTVTGGPDCKLIGQTLKISATLLHEKTIFEAMSSDFKNFLMERTISVLESRHQPKEIVKYQAFLLTIDKFLARHLKGQAAVRLVDALLKLHDHVSGDSILGLRLQIYQHLMSVANPHMLAKISDWLPQVWRGMLSNSKESRSAGTAAGALSATYLGHQKKASRAMKAFLESQTLSDTINFDYIENLLRHWLKDPEKRMRVPPIWSIVIMFMRSEPECLEKWSCLGRWLKIIQICFNSSDEALNREAWVHWNNLVFAVNPSGDTSALLRKHLLTPFKSFLGRSQSKLTSEQREASWSTYRLLLYYAFRPAISQETCQVFWTDFVLGAVPHIARSSHANVANFYEVLRSLLGSSGLRLWDVDRYSRSFVDSVYADEVPRLEAVWIRRHLDAVLEVFGHLFTKDSPSSPREIRKAEAALDMLFTTIAEAASKEVTVTREHKAAIASILNFLHHLADAACASPTSEQSTHYFYLTVNSAVKVLGPEIFVNQTITRGKSGLYEAAVNQQSHMSPGARFEIPVAAICQISARLKCTDRDSVSSQRYLAKVLRNCLGVQPDLSSQLSLLSACISGIKSDTTALRNDETYAITWKAIAESMTSCLSSSTNQGWPSGRLVTAHDYRHVTDTLLHAREVVPIVQASWATLYKALYAHAKASAGDGGILLAVLNPILGKHGIPEISSESSKLEAAAVICQQGISFADQRMIDLANRRLGFDKLDRDISDSAESFPHFFMDLMQWSLDMCSTTRIRSNLGPMERFLAALDPFLLSLPISKLTEFVELAQRGLNNLIHRRLPLIHDTQNDDDHRIDSMLFRVWSSVLRIFNDSSSTTAMLERFQYVFLFGLTGYSRSIAQRTIEIWNSTFGKQDDIGYPENLHALLVKLSGHAVILTPALSKPMSVSPKDTSETSLSNDRKLFMWLDSDIDWSEVSGIDSISHLRGTKVLNASSSATRRRQQRDSSRPSTPVSIVRPGPPATLRHQDSQIEFVAISSSPLAYSNLTSQLMTEHQQEVRERQQQDAAIFSGIGSSSCVSRAADTENAVAQSSKSPSIPSADESVCPDDEIDSSPLSRQRPHHQLHAIRGLAVSCQDSPDVDEVPSSPPEVELGVANVANSVRGSVKRHINFQRIRQIQLDDDLSSDAQDAADPAGISEPNADTQRSSTDFLEALVISSAANENTDSLQGPKSYSDKHRRGHRPLAVLSPNISAASSPAGGLTGHNLVVSADTTRVLDSFIDQRPPFCESVSKPLKSQESRAASSELRDESADSPVRAAISAQNEQESSTRPSPNSFVSKMRKAIDLIEPGLLGGSQSSSRHPVPDASNPPQEEDEPAHRHCDPELSDADVSVPLYEDEEAGDTICYEPPNGETLSFEEEFHKMSQESQQTSTSDSQQRKRGRPSTRLTINTNLKSLHREPRSGVKREDHNNDSTGGRSADVDLIASQDTSLPRKRGRPNRSLSIIESSDPVCLSSPTVQSQHRMKTRGQGNDVEFIQLVPRTRKTKSRAPKTSETSIRAKSSEAQVTVKSEAVDEDEARETGQDESPELAINADGDSSSDQRASDQDTDHHDHSFFTLHPTDSDLDTTPEKPVSDHPSTPSAARKRKRTPDEATDSSPARDQSQSPTMLSRARDIIGAMRGLLNSVRGFALGWEESERREIQDLATEMAHEAMHASKRRRITTEE